MVVIPTSNDVTLSYGLTKYDWIGRVLTLLGLLGLVALARWRGARRFARDAPRGADGDGHDGGGRSGGDNGSDGDPDGTYEHDEGEPPPDRKPWQPAPAPALP